MQVVRHLTYAGEDGARIDVDGRHGHKTDDIASVQAAFVDQSRYFTGRTTTLLRLTRHVDLHEHRPAGRAPPDLDREFRAVDRLPQRDVWRQRAHFVALQTTDEVPPWRVALRRQCLRFGNEILRAVLTEVDGIGGDGGSDLFEPDLFRHNDERHVVGRAAGGARRGADPLADLGQSRC